MNFTPEQLAKVKAAKSAEELLALAGAEGIALSKEEATKYFAEWHKEDALSEDELGNVSGGGCGDDEPEKPAAPPPSPLPPTVNIDGRDPHCPNCGDVIKVFDTQLKMDSAGYFDLYFCCTCARSYRFHQNGVWTED